MCCWQIVRLAVIFFHLIQQAIHHTTWKLSTLISLQSKLCKTHSIEDIPYFLQHWIYLFFLFSTFLWPISRVQVNFNSMRWPAISSKTKFLSKLARETRKKNLVYWISDEKHNQTPCRRSRITEERNSPQTEEQLTNCR